MPLMGTTCLAAMPAEGKAARTRLPMPMRTLAAKRSCRPPKNASLLCGLTRTDRGFLARPSPVGSQKRSSASAFADHLARPARNGSYVHDAASLSALVVYAQQSARLLNGDGPVPKEPASGGVCAWGSQPKGVSALVGGSCRGISPRAELHLLLGNRQGSDRLPSRIAPEDAEPGETAHVERWKNTRRKPLARFVRMRLSFSRVRGHATPACLLLFLSRSNHERAILLK
jgi:hypothetical protein